MISYIISLCVVLLLASIFAVITLCQQREIKALNRTIEQLAASRDELEERSRRRI